MNTEPHSASSLRTLQPERWRSLAAGEAGLCVHRWPSVSICVWQRQFFARIAGVTHNPNAGSVAIADPTAMEDAVWTAVDDADLRAWVESRHR